MLENRLQQEVVCCMLSYISYPFVAKFRRKVISPGIMAFFSLNTKYLMEFNGKMEHVHNLFKMLRSVAPSMVICSLKTRHSRKVRKRYSE